MKLLPMRMKGWGKHLIRFNKHFQGLEQEELILIY